MTTLALAAVLTLAPQSPQDTLKSRYRDWDTAYYIHDVKALAAILDPGFQIITGSGRVVSRRDYVASLWKSDLPEVYETTVLRLNVQGGNATAWTLERSKKAGSPEAVHRYQDKWRLRSGVWMLAQSKTVGDH